MNVYWIIKIKFWTHVKTDAQFRNLCGHLQEWGKAYQRVEAPTPKEVRKLWVG